MKIKNLVLSSTAALALFALSTTVANADTVTVKAGDTVSEIAQAHNTSISAIEKANNLANVNLIYVGDKLEVNGTSTTTATSAATSAAPQSVASQSTTSAASTTAVSASATSASSAAPQSVASQASSSVASQASSSATSQASQASTATSSSSVAVQSSASQASSAATSTAASSASTSQASSTASTTSTTSSYTGSNLKSYVLSQMASRTGESAEYWNTIITRESGWNTTIKNSTSGAYGLFQNMHISSGSVEDQVNAAVSLYNAQGKQAWAL